MPLQLNATKSSGCLPLWRAIEIPCPITGGAAVSEDTLSANAHRLRLPQGPVGRRYIMHLHGIIHDRWNGDK
jgi:hypothetical protein